MSDLTATFGSDGFVAERHASNSFTSIWPKPGPSLSHEHDRALEHGHQEQVLTAQSVGVIASDERPEFTSAGLNLLFGHQHRLDVTGIQLMRWHGHSVP